MKKRIISLICAFSILVGSFSVLPPLKINAESIDERSSTNSVVENQSLMLWYDEEAPYGEEDTYKGQPKNLDDGWERWSLPLGNGYFGANVFGRTNSERIQLSEKTLSNVYYTSKDTGGWNNFSETYIDFGHPFESVSDYSRSLDLKTAISSVEYVYDGVKYSREYLTSYEDYCMVIKLTADTEGKLAFTLRPTIPYLQDFAYHQGNPANTAYYEVTKHGKVTSSVDENGAVVNLSGHMGQFNIDFEAEYRVFTDGNVAAGSWTHTYNTNVVADVADEFNSGVRDADAQTLTVTNGTLEISDATEAYIVICIGTNYDQSKGAENSSIYTTGAYDQKLDASGVDAKAINDTRMANALNNSFNIAESLAEGYKALRDRHVADYSRMFGRVTFDLEIDENDLSRTTDELLERYKNDEGDGHYLEMLIFQYGRYLMIASSRENSLPSNLQGVWNRYNYSSWGAGMWHNINEQMNYWAAFSTNLTECFEAYVKLTDAYMEKARSYAASILKSAPFNYTGTDTGIAIAIGVTPYIYGSADSGKNAGNLGLTTQMFWDYYKFTADKTLLAETVYPILYEAAQFITKTVAYNESEDAYLSIYSDSPEQKVDGVWYYTEGTTYAQSYAYLNNKHLLEAAEILGYEDDALLTEVRRQIDKYDAIIVGLSGQVKEFREEDYYGDLGEYEHRHISHLLGLYPGEIINAETDAWIDAAKVTLTERGDLCSVGWSRALAISLWARTESAEEAYNVLSDLIKINTATNLWNLINMNDRGFFQVDGSFGATAGITEMLLQSHNGYIEPLAAIPESWSSGAYSGLVARGNFTVGAKWSEGLVSELTIISGSGGKCEIHLPGIGLAQIIDSKGNSILYTTPEIDCISFDTVAGESYSIIGISPVEKVIPASDLAVIQMSRNDYALSWEASENANSYNVYKAVGNAPAYTLVINTTDCNYTYTTSEEEENVRSTYRVTAVDKNGRESDGVLVYVNPTNTAIDDIQATALNDGRLQVLISSKATINTYTLYKYNTTSKSWEVSAESKYPVIISAYEANAKYAVSVTSGYFPSELHEIKEVGAVGGYIPVYEEDTSVNVFAGVEESDLEFSSTGGLTVYPAYPLINAFDGDTSTNASRWATTSKQNAAYTVTVSLKNKQVIKTLRLYDFRSYGETGVRSDDTKIEVYNNGEWITVISGAVLDRVEGQKYCEFDLGFVEAEKVRMTFLNTQGTNVATIYEVMATGAKVTYVPSDEEPELVENTGRNIFDGVEESDLAFSSTGGLTIYPAYPLIAAFDGDFTSNTSRWSTNQKQNAPYTVTITLDQAELVKTLRFYDYRNYNETGSRSNNTKVEVYFEGQWTTVLDGVVLDRADGKKYCELDLGFALAEKIRITFENTEAALCATIYELTGTGALAISTDRSALYDAIQAVEMVGIDSYDPAAVSMLKAELEKSVAMLCDINANAKAMDSQAKALREALEKASTMKSKITDFTADNGNYPFKETSYATVVGPAYGNTTSSYFISYANGSVNTYFDTGYRGPATVGNAWTVEFDALFVDSTTDFTFYTKYDTSYWGFNLVFKNGKVTIDKTSAVSGKGATLNGSTATLSTYEFGKWYRIAIVFPENPIEAGNRVYVYINGEKYTVTTNYSYRTTTLTINKMNAGDMYIDNMTLTDSEIAFYDGTKDIAPVIESVSEDIKVDNGDVILNRSMTVSELSNALGRDISVMNGYTMLDDNVIVEYGNTLVILPYGDCNAYSYYRIIVKDSSIPSVGNIVNGGLQVVVNQIENVAKYHLYVKTSTDSDWKKVVSSNYPILVCDGYNSTAQYATSVTYNDGIEGEIIPVANFGSVDRIDLLAAYKKFEVEAVLSDRDLTWELEYLSDVSALPSTINEYIVAINALTAQLKNKRVAYGELPTVTVGDTAQPAGFNSYNLSLAGDIKINVYTNFGSEILESYPNAKVVFVNLDDNYHRELLINSLPYDGNRYRLSITLTSVDMMDGIGMRIIFDDSTATEVKTASVWSYAHILLGNYEYESEHKLMEALLQYGAYAQSYFGVNTNNLPNQGLHVLDLETVDSTIDGDKHVTNSDFNAACGFSITKWTLSLQSNVQLKIYFTLAESLSHYDMNVVDEKGNSAQYSILDTADGYCLVIDGITACSMEYRYTITVTKRANGAITTVSVTPMTYVNRILNKGAVPADETNPDGLKNLCRALKLYADEAIKYESLEIRSYTVKADKYDGLKKFAYFTDENGNILSYDTTYKYTASSPKIVNAVYSEFLDVSISNAEPSIDTTYDSATHTVENLHWFNTAYVTTALSKGMTIEFTMSEQANQFVIGLATKNEIDNQGDYAFSSALPNLFVPSINYYYSNSDGAVLQSLVAGLGANGKIVDANASPNINYVGGSTKMNTYRLVLDDTLLLYINGELVRTSITHSIDDGVEYYFTIAAMQTDLKITEFGIDCYVSQRGSFDVDNLRYDPLTAEDLAGKKITFLGDSITAGTGASDRDHRYSTVLSTIVGMHETNMGIGGTVMCTSPDGVGRTSRIEDVYKISLNADYVIILLGINDFDNCVAGEDGYYSLGEFGSEDTSTIYGAANVMYKSLVDRFRDTDTKIFICTPVISAWNRSVSSVKDWDPLKENACGYTLRDLCEAQIEVAEYYGLNIIDLNLISGIETDEFTDGIHPNDDGMQKIAEAILQQLLMNGSYNV